MTWSQNARPISKDLFKNFSVEDALNPVKGPSICQIPFYKILYFFKFNIKVTPDGLYKSILLWFL